MAEMFGLAVDDINGTTLHAVAIVKYLDSDGDLCYKVLASDELLTVEAIGMVELARKRLLGGLK